MRDRNSNLPPSEVYIHCERTEYKRTCSWREICDRHIRLFSFRTPRSALNLVLGVHLLEERLMPRKQEEGGSEPCQRKRRADHVGGLDGKKVP
jgi:hypothetical protein